MVYISDYYNKLFRLVLFVLLAFTFITNGNNESSVSIIFVFDTTGSMADVLWQLKKHALKILEHIETVESNITSFNYILVPFNDPDVGSPVITNDKREFLMAINGIKLTGGGDCAEPSLTALKKGLEVGGNMSHVFLFTDADSKERFVSPDLRYLIQTKKPSLYFIIAGKCNDEFHDPVYQNLANISNGQYFYVSKNDVGTLLSKLESNLKPRVHSKDFLSETPEEEKQPIPIMYFIQRPSVAFENDDILFNCSLSPLLDHFVSKRPIKLTIYFNGRQRVLHEKFIRDSQNGSIEYRIKSVENNKNNGEYECVASRQSVADGSIDLDVVQKISLRGMNNNKKKLRKKRLIWYSILVEID